MNARKPLRSLGQTEPSINKLNAIESKVALLGSTAISGFIYLYKECKQRMSLIQKSLHDCMRHYRNILSDLKVLDDVSRLQWISFPEYPVSH